jgi:hypothetical protein
VQGGAFCIIPYKTAEELLVLLLLQLLLFGDIGLHLGGGPALKVGLAVAGDAQRLGRHILGDGAACGGVSAVAYLDRGYKVGVAANEAVIADLGAELILAVVVAGDGAAAEVAVLAHVTIADVGQVAHGVAPGKVGVFGLHIGTQMHAVVGDSVHPHMGEGADVVVGAQMAAVDLAGVDGGALVHGAVLDQGIGADDAACADDRLAAQDGACQNGGSRGDDNALVDLDGAALNVYAVGDVKKQDVLALALGSVQFGACCGQSFVGNGFHK